MPTGEVVIAHQQLLSAVSFRFSVARDLERLTVAKTASGRGAILLVKLLRDGPVGGRRKGREIVKGVTVDGSEKRRGHGRESYGQNVQDVMWGSAAALGRVE